MKKIGKKVERVLHFKNILYSFKAIRKKLISNYQNDF